MDLGVKKEECKEEDEEKVTTTPRDAIWSTYLQAPVLLFNPRSAMWLSELHVGAFRGSLLGD